LVGALREAPFGWFFFLQMALVIFCWLNWTHAVLLLPQAEELPSTSEVVSHFDIKAMFKVCFPL